jgi:hypothetical protein
MSHHSTQPDRCHILLKEYDRMSKGMDRKKEAKKANKAIRYSSAS